MNREEQLQQEIEHHKKVVKVLIRVGSICIFLVVIMVASLCVNAHYVLNEDPPEPTPPTPPPTTPMQEHYNALDTFQYSDRSKGTSRFDWDARKRGILINE